MYMGSFFKRRGENHGIILIRIHLCIREGLADNEFYRTKPLVFFRVFLIDDYVYPSSTPHKMCCIRNIDDNIFVQTTCQMHAELEYGGSIQKKINEGLELTSDEQKFMVKRYGNYADANINNANELCEREKIIKKYI